MCDFAGFVCFCFVVLFVCFKREREKSIKLFGEGGGKNLGGIGEEENMIKIYCMKILVFNLKS